MDDSLETRSRSFTDWILASLYSLTAFHTFKWRGFPTNSCIQISVHNQEAVWEPVIICALPLDKCLDNVWFGVGSWRCCLFSVFSCNSHWIFPRLPSGGPFCVKMHHYSVDWTESLSKQSWIVHLWLVQLELFWSDHHSTLLVCPFLVLGCVTPTQTTLKYKVFKFEGWQEIKIPPIQFLNACHWSYFEWFLNTSIFFYLDF